METSGRTDSKVTPSTSSRMINIDFVPRALVLGERGLQSQVDSRLTRLQSTPCKKPLGSQLPLLCTSAGRQFSEEYPNFQHPNVAGQNSDSKIGFGERHAWNLPNSAAISAQSLPFFCTIFRIFNLQQISFSCAQQRTIAIFRISEADNELEKPPPSCSGKLMLHAGCR